MLDSELRIVTIGRMTYRENDRQIQPQYWSISPATELSEGTETGLLIQVLSPFSLIPDPHTYRGVPQLPDGQPFVGPLYTAKIKYGKLPVVFVSGARSADYAAVFANPDGSVSVTYASAGNWRKSVTAGKSLFLPDTDIFKQPIRISGITRLYSDDGKLLSAASGPGTAVMSQDVDGNIKQVPTGFNLNYSPHYPQMLIVLTDLIAFPPPYGIGRRLPPNRTGYDLILLTVCDRTKK